MSADCSVPVVTTLVCFLLSHARLRVRAAHPAFPAPSFIEGHCLAKLGHAARLRIYVLGCLKIESENRADFDPRHCEERSDDPPSLGMRAMAGLESAEAPLRVGGSNPFFLWAAKMDCFAEPVIGRPFGPTRWLAITRMQ